MGKILVAVDGSTTSKKAAMKAIEMAKKYESELIFISVARSPERMVSTGSGGFGSSGYGDYDLYKVSEDLTNYQKHILDQLVSELDLTGIKTEKHILVGTPGEEIVDFAEKADVDMIVIGRRGYSRIKRFFVGSVSHRVVSEAHCPVVVINDDHPD